MKLTLRYLRRQGKVMIVITLCMMTLLLTVIIVNAGNGSWNDFYGGSTKGSSWITQDGNLLYGNATTWRTPTNGDRQSTTIDGRTTCGGYDHQISYFQTDAQYAPATGATLAGSTYCPGTPSWVVFSINARLYSTSPFVGGTTGENRALP